MLKALRKRMKGQKGFTLVELLVVIIIIAILSAIAIPTYLGQRGKAQDAACKSLVRNAMTAVESAYTDTQSFSNAADATGTAALAQAIEPSITFTNVAADPKAAATSLTKNNAVDFYATGVGVQIYTLASKSVSGTTYAVVVNKATGTTYYKAGTGSTTGW